MLAPIQSSALELNPDGVADCIGLSEGPGPGSNPGRDSCGPQKTTALRSADARLPCSIAGSTPGRATSLASVPDQHGSIRSCNDQPAVGARVQFLGEALRSTSLGCAGFAHDP